MTQDATAAWSVRSALSAPSGDEVKFPCRRTSTIVAALASAGISRMFTGRAPAMRRSFANGFLANRVTNRN
jgi:hypothetical protein